MPVTNFQSFMLPALKALADGTETRISEVRDRIAAAEGLTDEDLHETLSSGQNRFANRVQWVVTHLERAGLLERARRGVWRLTAEGKRFLLADPPPRIGRKHLRNYPSFLAWENRSNTPSAGGDAAPTLSVDSGDSDSAGTPEETLEQAVRQLRDALETEQQPTN